MFIFQKKFRKLSYGYENQYEILKTWENFTKIVKFLWKTRSYCTLGYIFSFAYFLKRCRGVLWSTSVGRNLKRTSVGGNLRRFLQSNSNSDILYSKIDIFFAFFLNTWKGPRKYVGSCKSQKNFGRRKFEKYFNTKKLIGKRSAGSPRKGLLPSIIELLFSNITVTLEISGSFVSKNERNFEKFNFHW